MWLRDFLPGDMSHPLKARIMIYGYNTQLQESQSEQGITDLSKSLLEATKACRGENSVSLFEGLSSVSKVEKLT